MKKCCKIFPLYFSKKRRCAPRSWQEAKELIDYVLLWENTVYAGVETDLIMVNMTDNPESIEYFKNLDGEKTKSGKILCVHKGNDVGISFGAYDLVFRMALDAMKSLSGFKYDYWFFLEDDQIITQENYMLDYIRQLDSSPDLAFVAAIGIARIGQKLEHAQDGTGCTSFKYLNELYEKRGSLPHCPQPGFPQSAPYKTKKFRQEFWKNHIFGGEIAFTNHLVRLGYKIEKFNGNKSYVRWISGNSEKQDIQEWGVSNFVHKREYDFI